MTNEKKPKFEVRTLANGTQIATLIKEPKRKDGLEKEGNKPEEEK